MSRAYLAMAKLIGRNGPCYSSVTAAINAVADITHLIGSWFGQARRPQSSDADDRARASSIAARSISICATSLGLPAAPFIVIRSSSDATT